MGNNVNQVPIGSKEAGVELNDFLFVNGGEYGF